MHIHQQFYGVTLSGATASLFTMKNDNGVTVAITDFGGTIVNLITPDRNGKMLDVVMGYDSLRDYETADGYLGALVGRVANRIAGGRFELDGEVYDKLYINDGDNHLHGGKVSMSYVIWGVREFAADDKTCRLVLTYRSPDGDEGYPGNLDVTVTYTLDNTNSLSIRYEAVTDKATPLNLTNHAYFNLGGYASGSVLGHELWVDAESFLVTDAALIPTGEVRPVDGTPLDFRTPKLIGRDFFADYEPLHLAGGYDHCLNFTDWKNTAGGDLILRGLLRDPVSGRRMEVLTNQPCVQFYSSNFLKNPLFPLKGGLQQRTQTAICLETQNMAGSIQQQGNPDFTDCVLRPGEVYDYTTVYRFSAE